MPDGEKIAGTPPLAPGSVHVWAGSVRHAATPLRGTRWLSSAEQSHAESYRFPADRDRYLLARVMLRGLLGEYLQADPALLEFETGELGKPQLASPAAAGLEFNSSRSHDVALCAFCPGRPVGIDVELVRTDMDLESMAATAFAPADIARISQARESARAELFFESWTRKEAAAKMSGAGLNADMATVDDPRLSIVPLDVPPGYVAHLATADPVSSIVTLKWDSRH